MGVEVEFKDITREPPPREFLEKHVDGSRLSDFLSKRSRVFKERPMPSTKQEAIDLMLQQPNLIRRPVLAKGSTALFGFDKDEYKRTLSR